MNIAEILVMGLRIGTLDEKLARYVENVNTNCALTGARITRGIPVRRVVSSATGEFLDLTSGQITGYFSESSARAFKGTRNMGSVLIFTDGTCYRPFISAVSTEGTERPYWSALARAIWPARSGQECLIIVAADVKKKVWPWAQMGFLGEHTPVLLFDSSRAQLGVERINWPALITTLDFIEELYTSGFTKKTIADNLFTDIKTMEVCGYAKTLDYETQLIQMRPSAEFKFSIIIAQKGAIE